MKIVIPPVKIFKLTPSLTALWAASDQAVICNQPCVIPTAQFSFLHTTLTLQASPTVVMSPFDFVPGLLQFACVLDANVSERVKAARQRLEANQRACPLSACLAYR